MHLGHLELPEHPTPSAEEGSLCTNQLFTDSSNQPRTFPHATTTEADQAITGSPGQAASSHVCPRMLSAGLAELSTCHRSAATAQDTVKSQQGLPAPFTTARRSSQLQRGALAQHGPGSVLADEAADAVSPTPAHAAR